MRKALAIGLMLLMLTGCARPGRPPGPADGPVAPGPIGADPAKVYGDPVPAGPAGPIESLLPIPAPLPQGVRRVEVAAGRAIESPGVYFMDLATGNLEGWLQPLNQDGWPAFSMWPAENGRWVIINDREAGYLFRRSGGGALHYNPQRLELITGPGVILARPTQWTLGDGTRCALLDEQGNLISTFALPDGCMRSNVLFSPDGKYLAVEAHGRDLFIVTVASGEVRKVGAFVAPGGLRYSRLSLSSLDGSGELVAAFSLESSTAEYKPPATHLRRFTWSGELRAEMQVPGEVVALSADGKLVTYTESLGIIGQATVVQEWGAESPLFRVAGGFAPQWLANSQELLLSSSRGYQLVTAGGSMRAAGLLPDSDFFQPFRWLRPSPHDADLFLTSEAATVSRAGVVRPAPALADPERLRIYSAGWADRGQGITFMAMPPAGKGWDPDVSFYFGPQLQRPPFAERYPLQVADPKGECLNLRAEPKVEGQLIRCLPQGTRMTPVSQRGTEYPVHWDQEVWLHVETEQGELGWVAVSTRSVGHVE